jgi:hypothetical protein
MTVTAEQLIIALGVAILVYLWILELHIITLREDVSELLSRPHDPAKIRFDADT